MNLQKIFKFGTVKTVFGPLQHHWTKDSK